MFYLTAVHMHGKQPTKCQGTNKLADNELKPIIENLVETFAPEPDII